MEGLLSRGSTSIISAQAVNIASGNACWVNRQLKQPHIYIWWGREGSDKGATLGNCSHDCLRLSSWADYVDPIWYIDIQSWQNLCPEESEG